MAKDSLGNLLFWLAVFVTAIFSILKLCKVIAWSWWWILWPIWLWILIMILSIWATFKSMMDDDPNDNFFN
jgi:energy-coupling factor transporter transmembrane protein EcfT